MDDTAKNTMSAQAIRLKSRYFYGFSKTGRAQTAWSLAGAKLFRFGHPEIDSVVGRLHKKGYAGEIVTVVVTGRRSEPIGLPQEQFDRLITAV